MNTVTPVLFMDFDGVLNFEGSRNKRLGNPDTLGYLKKADVFTGGMWDRINWSGELVYKLNELKKACPYQWFWLTTWMSDTGLLDGKLGVQSDGTVHWDKGKFPYWVSVDEVSAYRSAAKLEKVLEWVNSNPAVPFAWVDDEATSLWTDKVASQVTNPHLVLKPNPSFGMGLKEFVSLKEFFEKVTAD